MLHARRTIPITALLLLSAAIASAGDGIWTSSSPRIEVRALATDSQGVVYAASGTAVIASADGGASWTSGAGDLLDVQSLISDTAHPSTLFAGTAMGLFKSSDGGAHFFATALQEAAGPVATDAAGSALLCAAPNSHRVLKSSDGGATWHATLTMPTVARIAALLFHPSHANVVYAGLEGDMSYYPLAVSRSLDGGDRWAASLYSDPFGDAAVAFAAGEGNAVYAAVNGPSGGRVAVSTHGGNGSWNETNLGERTRVTSLAVDRSGGVWAGTNLGVFFSSDLSRSWSPMNGGLSDLQVSSLVVSPLGDRVYAGTSTGVFELNLPPLPPPGPCVEDAEHLCLVGGRFRVSLTARNPRTGIVGPGAANAEGDRFGFFALPEFTGDATFPEVLVKMLDETALPGHSFWFFYSGLTDLAYVMSVQDTTTGEVRTYGNAESSPFCGGADTGLFPVGSSSTVVSRRRASELPAGEDPALSLLGGRFEVTLSASDPNRGNRTTSGAAIPWNDRSGYFSLPEFTGDATFPEVFVKMVDFTSVSGRFWFFFTGLTSLPYTLTVTDHATGAVRTYENPGEFCGEADTSAFPEVTAPALR